MRKTKIIGTIGPSSINYNVMKNLVVAGLDIVRINLSHANVQDMNIIVENVKNIRNELNVPLPIMIDTRGPEIRVENFKDGFAEIKKGQIFSFIGKHIEGDNNKVSLNEPGIIKSVKPGNKILANDGLIVFEVLEVQKNEIITKAKNSGILKNRKSLCIPGIEFTTPYLNEEDKKDILWAIKNDVDIIAASFVNSDKDVLDLKEFIKNNNGNMKIISKIESQKGIKNIDQIINISDGVMVARGDLGVEVAIEVLPELQKLIIKKSIQKGKTVVTATEMLESMIYNNRPTRAEVSDVANAVYDGTSCVMLSAETAAGNYPVEAVRTMSKVCVVTEKSTTFNNTVRLITENDVTDFISKGVVSAGNSGNLKLIASFTDSGATASFISAYRPKNTIIAFTPNEKVYRQLAMVWGVMPMLSSKHKSTDQMFRMANDELKKKKLVKKGDKIVVTSGIPNVSGGTNLMKIIEIK